MRRRSQLATLGRYFSLNYQDAVLDKPELRNKPSASPAYGDVERRLTDKGYRHVRQRGSFRRYQEEAIQVNKAQLGERAYAELEREHEELWLAAQPDLPVAQIYQEAKAIESEMVQTRMRQSTSPASPLFVQSITAPVVTTVDFKLFTYCYDPTACLNCTVVENYIQDLSDQLNFCLNEVIPKVRAVRERECVCVQSYDSRTHIQGIQSDPLTWFLGYDNCSLNTGLLENFRLFKDASQVPVVTGAGISLGERILNFLTWITFSVVNWWALVQQVGAFILNGDFNSSNSILYWLKFFATCNEQQAERFQCGTGGLGFFTALWVQVRSANVILSLSHAASRVWCGY